LDHRTRHRLKHYFERSRAADPASTRDVADSGGVYAVASQSPPLGPSYLFSAELAAPRIQGLDVHPLLRLSVLDEARYLALGVAVVLLAAWSISQRAPAKAPEASSKLFSSAESWHPKNLCVLNWVTSLSISEARSLAAWSIVCGSSDSIAEWYVVKSCLMVRAT
jgi:hypothetical protein